MSPVLGNLLPCIECERNKVRKLLWEAIESNWLGLTQEQEPRQSLVQYF